MIIRTTKKAKKTAKKVTLKKTSIKKTGKGFLDLAGIWADHTSLDSKKLREEAWKRS